MTPQTILAIGPLGTSEMIVIAIMVLVLFGSKKLPGFARSLGKSMGEFKRAREEFEHELHRAAEEPEPPKAVAEKPAVVQSQPRVPASIEA